MPFWHLNFAYVDNRPARIVEQELTILRQGSHTIIKYYNKVNEKLNLLINKTIMTYRSDSEVKKELNTKNVSETLIYYKIEWKFCEYFVTVISKRFTIRIAKSAGIEVN